MSRNNKINSELKTQNSKYFLGFGIWDLGFRRRRAGVTLIELLVAVVLLSLLMLTFYTVFKMGNKAYETGEKRVELIQNARIALDMMASQIRQALPPVAGDNPDVVFEIETYSRWITFYAPIDGTEGAEKIQFSRYSGEPGTGAETNTLYKMVLNPPYQTSEGGYSSHNPGSQQITADLPMTETEGIVTGLLFEEEDSGLIRITMKFKADPADNNEPETVLYDIVKAGFCYGAGMGGGFSE